MLKQGDSLFNPIADIGENIQAVADMTQERGSRVGSNLYDLVQEFKKGNYGQSALKGVDVAADVVGAVGEGLGSVPMAIMDLVTPDSVTTPVISAIMGSDTAQEAFTKVSEFAKNNPNAARGAKWMMDFTSFLPIWRARHALPENLNTLLTGFYAGGPVAQANAVVENTPEAVRRTVTQLTNPQEIATYREHGLTRGVLEQVGYPLRASENNRVLQLERQMDALIKKRKSATDSEKIAIDAQVQSLAKEATDIRTKTAQELRAELAKKAQTKKDDPFWVKQEAYKYQQQLDRMDASAAGGAYEYLQDYATQTGRTKEVLTDVWTAGNILDQGTMDFSEFRNMLTNPSRAVVDTRKAPKINKRTGVETPIMAKGYGDPALIDMMLADTPYGNNIVESLHSRLMSWHGKGYRPQDVIIHTKDPLSQENIINELFGKDSTAKNPTVKSISNLLYDNVGLSLDDLANPPVALRKFSMALLDPEDARYLRDNPTPPTHKGQRKKWDRLNALLEGKQRGVKYNKEKDLYEFSESYLSRAKALGGMNTAFSVDRSGNFIGLPNDGHDMMGLLPIGGKPMINVYPPIAFNIFDNDWKSARASYDSKAKSGLSKQQQGQRLEDKYEVPLIPEYRGYGISPSRMQEMRTLEKVARETTAKPRDYLEAGANTLGLTGMLTNAGASVQPLREPTEEQRRPPQGLLTGSTGRFL